MHTHRNAHGLRPSIFCYNFNSMFLGRLFNGIWIDFPSIAFFFAVRHADTETHTHTHAHIHANTEMHTDGGQLWDGAELASAASERSDRRCGEGSDRRRGETSKQTDMGLTVTGRRTNRRVEGNAHSCRGILFLTHSNTSARGRTQQKTDKQANGGRTEKQRDAE